jgi:hypothetical protein
MYPLLLSKYCVGEVLPLRFSASVALVDALSDKKFLEIPVLSVYLTCNSLIVFIYLVVASALIAKVFAELIQPMHWNSESSTLSP